MSSRAKQHLSRLHEHGLPRWVNWQRLSQAIISAIHEVEILYPPERLWVFDPQGELRGTYTGNEGSVTVPIQELWKLYQAVLLHTHPPGKLPTVRDVWYATIAASPLLAVLEGETVHLVTVWHTQAPGMVGALLEQETTADLHHALCRVKGRWQMVPLKALEVALCSLEREWEAFITAMGGA